MVVLNNNEKEQTLDLKRFNESLKDFSIAKEPLSGKEILLSSNNLTVSAKSPLILELN
jgi:DNA polymerase III sliding clamp (beta) subunit (PCNA family)